MRQFSQNFMPTLTNDAMSRLVKDEKVETFVIELEIFFVSVLKSIALTVTCVLINVFGIFASIMTDDILFLDFSGTVAIAIIYGPIHAALVGIISTYLGEMYLAQLIPAFPEEHFKDYFLFGPVHMAIGTVVFFIPRLLRGEFLTDFFCGNDAKYPAGKLLISIISLALITNLAASATTATIMSIDSLQVTCTDLINRGISSKDQQTESASSSNDKQVERNISSNYQQVCKFTQLMFGEAGYETNYNLIKLAVSKFLMSFPDHLVCLSSAIAVVSFVLDSRRYKMSSKFAQTVITNHPAVGTIYFFLFLGFVCLYTIDVYKHAGIAAAFIAWNFYNVFIVSIAFMIISGRFNVWWFKPQRKHVIRKKYTHSQFNDKMKDAYEDSMKFAILYSVVLYFIVASAKIEWQLEMSEYFQQKLIGALGVVFIISLIRYLVLIVARVGRYLGEPWRKKKNSNKSKEAENADKSEKRAEQTKRTRPTI